MIIFYHCKKCNFDFSIAATGQEPDVKCPKCHSKKPSRIYRKFINKKKGLSVKENLPKFLGNLNDAKYLNNLKECDKNMKKNKKEKNKDMVKSMDAGTLKTPDLRQRMKDFITQDDKKYILLFQAINLMDIAEAEMFESVMLRVSDTVKETMLNYDVYDKEDLSDLDIILLFVKQHIGMLECDDTEVKDTSGGMRLSYGT